VGVKKWAISDCSPSPSPPPVEGGGILGGFTDRNYLVFCSAGKSYTSTGQNEYRLIIISAINMPGYLYKGGVRQCQKFSEKSIEKFKIQSSQFE
jgi:hypothetical protein